MRKIILFFLPFFLILFFFHFWVKSLNLPDYGSWTGLRSIEIKLKLYEEFASKGDVDAVIIGSFISDFGFSAERFSELMSEKNGKPYRVFNFSIGGAELPTIYKILNFILCVKKPKELYLVNPLGKEVEGGEFNVNSPDFILKTSPAGNFVNNPFLLKLSYYFFYKSFLNDLMALKDKLIYGKYIHLQSGYLDVYSFSSHGDLQSYEVWFDANGIENTKKYLDDIWHNYSKIFQGSENIDIKKFYQTYQLEYLENIISTCKKNEINVLYIPHDTYIGYMSKNKDVTILKNRIHSEIANKYNLKIHSLIGLLELNELHASEPVHFNLYSAMEFSEKLFNQMHSIQTDSSQKYNYDTSLYLRENAERLLFGQMLFKSGKNKKKKLNIEFMKNWQVPFFPSSGSSIRFYYSNSKTESFNLDSNTSYVFTLNHPSDQNEFIFVNIFYNQKPHVFRIDNYNWID